MVTSPFSLLRAAGRTSIVLSFIAALFSCFSPFDFGDSSASAESAEVELRFGTTAVSSGGSLDLGSVLVDRHKDVTLAIRNKGSKYLLLTGDPAVAFEGEGASQFELKTTSFSTVLPVDGYQAFKVRFTPASLGTKSVKLKIACGNASCARFIVTVSCTADPVAATGLSLSASELALQAGEMGLLTATVLPANATYTGVTWASADPSVATVSDTGLVTAVSGGSTTVTVTTDDGGHTAACGVNVYNPASWIDISAGSSSPFTARRYHQSLAYDGKLYLIGGNRSDDVILNDVWSSTDGVNWTEILTNNPTLGLTTQFAQRRNHQCCVFKDKMWVVGGEYWSGTTITKNDVWSSEDGETWEQVLGDTASPGPNQFPQRSAFSVLTDGDTMYILGGSLNESTLTNDVWSSTDGETWTKVRADGAANGFTARGGNAFFDLNGTFYVLAGNDASGTANDVWSSSDKGATWTKLSDTVFALPHARFAFASYGGKVWIACGFHDFYVPMNDLWSSTDGVTWTEVLADGNAVFPQRFSATLTAFNNKLYIIAGGTGTSASTALNDVWQVQ